MNKLKVGIRGYVESWARSMNLDSEDKKKLERAFNWVAKQSVKEAIQPKEIETKSAEEMFPYKSEDDACPTRPLNRIRAYNNRQADRREGYKKASSQPVTVSEEEYACDTCRYYPCNPMNTDVKLKVGKCGDYCKKSSPQPEKDEWVSVEDDLPLCNERSFDWDGERSDFCIVKLSNDKYDIARLYKGFMDGSEFAEWYDNDDCDFGRESVIEWKAFKPT